MSKKLDADIAKDSEIEKLKKDIDKLKGQKESFKITDWSLILVSSVIGAVIFILVMILFQKLFGFEISYENSATIVLAFVGIAATFVVVSNYAQVQDVKKEFSEKVKKLEIDIQRSFDNAADNIEKRASEASEEAVSNSLYVLGNHLYDTKIDESYKYSLFCFVKSFYLFKKSEKRYYNPMEEKCIVKIHQISGKAKGLTISEEQKESYLNMLEKIDESDELKVPIIQFIKRLPISN